MKQSPSGGRKAAVWLTPLLLPALLAVILLAASFDDGSEKKIGLLSALACAVISLTPRFRQRVRERASVFFYLVLGYVALYGAASLYGDVPGFALTELCRVLTGFAVFLAVFAFVTKENLRQVLFLFSGAAAILGWLCLDAASVRWLGGPFYRVLVSLIPHYAGTEAGYGGNRLLGMFGNSNTMAFLCAVALLMALYLLLTAEGRRSRVLPLVLLFLNAFTFIMCVSIGAILSLGFSVLVCVVLARGRRTGLSVLVVTLETLLAVLLAALLSYRGFGAYGSANGFLVPLAAVAGAALLAVLDLFLRERLTEAWAARRRTLLLSLLGAAAVCAAFAAAALTVTAPKVLARGESVRYTIYPGAGVCTLRLEAEGAGAVTVHTRTAEEILMGTETFAAEGPAGEPVTFTVPAEAEDVLIGVSAAGEEALTLRSVEYAGGERSGEIAPAYRLLPENVVERFRGLRTNQSARVRLTLMRDGLRMWRSAPILGHGPGGFSNNLLAVQDYYYETMYAHGHFVQVLVELGLVGLAVFLALLAFGFRTVFDLRKREDGGAGFACLLGAMTMITVHSALEFNLSAGEGILYSFAVWGLTAAAAQPLRWKKPAAAAQLNACGQAVWFAVFAALIAGNLLAADKVEKASYADELEAAAVLDVFEGDNYLMTFVSVAPQSQDAGYIARAEEHAAKLARSKHYQTPLVLAEFYYTIGRPEQARAMAELHMQRNRSNPAAWDRLFELYGEVLQNRLATGDPEVIAGTAAYAAGWLADYDRLLETDRAQLDSLSLHAENQAFVQRLREAEALGFENTAAVLELFRG